MAQYGVFQYGTDQYGKGDPTTPGGPPSIGHQFNLNAIPRVVDTPQINNTFNQFDEHGLLSNLSRIRGETNWAYKRRIINVFVNQANSTYRGLINGITRELGLELFCPIKIQPKTSSVDGRFFAADPYIKFDGVWLYLYSDLANNVLELKIDRFEPGGNCEHVYRLVNFINQHSTYFEAFLEPNIDPLTRSMTIINQSNREYIANETIVESTKIQLKNNHLVPGTLAFSDIKAFIKEVDSSSVVTNPGDYHVDYLRGIITTNVVPVPASIVDYQYTIYPFCPLASPVILHDINNDNFKIKMFKQVLQDDGTNEHGLPTEIGVDIINELISVSPMYWGI